MMAARHNLSTDLSRNRSDSVYYAIEEEKYALRFLQSALGSTHDTTDVKLLHYSAELIDWLGR